MISKNRAKFIKSLQLKKFRKQEGLFVVEGGKSVLEVMQSGFSVIDLYATESFYLLNEEIFKSSQVKAQLCSEAELGQAGSLKSNNAALAVVRLPDYSLDFPHPEEFAVALDNVRDPGNLGTIVRVADWYGISKIYCSPETTDVFAPKVVQSCMGSLARVKVFYTSLEELITKSSMPVYGAVLNGKSIYEERFDRAGILLLGNESNGISPELLRLITNAVTIPGHGGAESLNVAIATAVLCDNMRRPKA